MDIDLGLAREIAREGSDRYTLQRKLKDRFEDLGAVLWALHRDGVIDCSTDDGWWSDLSDAEGKFSAADVAQLLVAASRHEDMGGLIDDWPAHLSGWNIYCRNLVEAVIADPEPLIAAFRTVPEPMRSPFGVELVCHGVLGVGDLPSDTLERLAGPAVREVGWQQLAKKLATAYPAEQLGEALNRAAATPGNDIWSLGFLEWTEPFQTPDTLAGLALNIDYASTVVEMLAVMDRHPEGLEDAILARRASGQKPADFGIVALGWIARQAAANGGTLAPALAKELLTEVKDDLTDDTLASILAGVPQDLLEPWALGRLGERQRDLRPVAACCTGKTAAAAIAIVQKQGRGEFRSVGADAAFAAVARGFPELLVAALAKKSPHRVIFVRGLGAATDPVVLPALVEALGDSVADVREAAAAALVAFGPSALDAVADALRSRKKDVRLAAADALVGLGGERAKDVAVSVLESEKADDVREKLQALTVAAKASTDAWVEARRAALTEEVKDSWDKVWGQIRYDRTPLADGAAQIVADHGAAAVIVAYDGLFRSRGHTTPKLEMWTAVLERSAVDAENAELAIRMVVGWPIGAENFDDTVEAHDRAIRRFYAAAHAQFGDLLVPGVVKVLTEADGSGHDELWAFGLKHGWPEVRALFPALAAKASPRFLEEALPVLGAEVLPVIAERLAARTADVRLATAEILARVPTAEALPTIEARLASDRSGPVRTVLARAAFAAASVGAAAIATAPFEVVDGRLAGWPPPVPDGLDGLALSWSNGTPLSAGAAAFVFGRLSEESPSRHDPLLAELRPRLDPGSRHQLWSALQKRFAGQEVARTGWVLFSGAILADDEAMRTLGRTLDDEARGGGSAVAFYKLEVLARHGGSGALGWIDHWSRHAKSQGLKARAEDALEAAALRLGVSRDEIADRATPDFGFAVDGTCPLPFAGRTLSLRLRANGTIDLLDEKGAILAKPPAAGSKDEKAAFTALKKQVAVVTRGAAERLEQGMITGRRMGRDTFLATFGANAVLAVVGRGVVWAAYADGAQIAAVRMVDGGLVDLDGKPWAWPDGVVLGVVHPLELDVSARTAIAGKIAGFGQLPPFRQLDRPVYTLDAGEQAPKRLERYDQEAFETRRLRSTLEGRGWTRGEPQDAGAVQWFTKPFPRAGLTAVIRMSPGFSIGGGDFEGGAQRVPAVEFVPGRYGRSLPWRLEPIPPATVDAIAFSEVVADVEAARAP